MSRRKKNKPEVPADKQPELRRVAAFVPWLLCAAAAALHVAVLTLVPYQGETVLMVHLGMVAIPGLLTMILLPGQWARWYRWAAITGLAYTTYTDVFPIVLLIAETWALHRAWEAERGATLRDLFSLRRPAPRIA